MTVLMPSWYYEKKDLKRSPSILDGLDPDRESRYRREGARFIINVGTKMGLRYDTMATGVVYFHRFYMFHSFKTFPRYVTACCCLFLAGKVEETPKKCKDIIKTAKTFLIDSQFLQFGDDPKEEVMTLERILLQTIKFDLQVDHPYTHLLRYAKSLKGDKGKLQHMVQMAWTFINDSLCTTLCLQFEPEVIAIALMYLAGKLSKFEVVDWVTRTSRHNHWWDMFVEGMSVGLLEDICHQVLDLYSTPNPNADQDSPPATPPTKSTRKMSQPPSPMETCTSPAQVKPKVEAIVGQPIPRLEPGELKRKIPHAEPKKEPVEKKITKPIEGKAIPTIIHNSPPKIVKKSITMQSEPQPPSPTSPVMESTPSKIVKVPEVVLHRSTSSEPAFSAGITSGNRVAFAHAMVDELLSSKSKSSIVAVTTNYSTAPLPPLPATYTQAVPAPPFYSSTSHETQSFSTVQQPPPPQMYPMQFQRPPPPPPPNSSVPPPQYGSMPPYPPPPRPQAPPPPPPQHDFESGYHHRQPPPPGQFGPNFERPPRNMRPQFLLDHRNAERSPRPPNSSVPPTQYGSMPPYPPPPRPQAPPPSPPQHEFESGYLHRQPPPPGQFGPNFERSPRNMRPRFLLDHRNAERGPHPPMGLLPKPRSSTSIAPVRITGSM